MAFGFFRRRQKMVVVIMAVLMVSFLVGPMAFKRLTTTSREDTVVGLSSVGEVKYGDLRQAYVEVEILGRFVGLGNLQRMFQQRMTQQPYWPTDMEYLTLAASPRIDLAYALLIKEAEKAGSRATESDVDTFFGQLGCPTGTDSYKSMVAVIKTRTKLTEKNLRAAVRRWLGVHKMYVAAAADVPPSELELRKLYQDTTEQISLLAAKIPADKFVDEVGEISEEEILEQFNGFKDVEPDVYESVGSFGFGYRQPDRVKISYMFFNADAVRQISTPSDKTVRDYFLRNRGEFVKKIPVDAGEDTNEQTSTTTPAEEPEFRTEPMEFSEAKTQILEKLRDQAIALRLQDLFARVETLLSESEGGSRNVSSPYEWAKEKVTLSAAEALGAKLSVVEIKNQPLEKALEILTELAGLEAICFPFEIEGDQTLDREVKVTLTARDITLDEALKSICEKVKWPEVTWAMCEGFEGVLFPVGGGTELFPLEIGQTPLVDKRGLLELGGKVEDNILANCFTSADQPLVLAAFRVEGLLEPGEGAALVKIDEDGPRMFARGTRSGMLLWRVTQAVAAHAPGELTPELRQQVLDDIKIRKAFGKAIEKGREIVEQAKQKGLTAAAKQADLETLTTDLFPRKIQISPQQQAWLRGQMGLIPFLESMKGFFLAEPVAFYWSEIPDIELPTAELRAFLIDAAFKLVPEDIEPAEDANEPYPKKPYAVSGIELPTRREVLIIQREDFRPAVADGYEKGGRQKLLMNLMARNRALMRFRWFGMNDVAKRLGFTQR